MEAQMLDTPNTAILAQHLVEAPAQAHAGLQCGQTPSCCRDGPGHSADPGTRRIDEADMDIPKLKCHEGFSPLPPTAQDDICAHRGRQETPILAKEADDTVKRTINSVETETQ